MFKTRQLPKATRFIEDVKIGILSSIVFDIYSSCYLYYLVVDWQMSVSFPKQLRLDSLLKRSYYVGAWRLNGSFLLEPGKCFRNPCTSQVPAV